MTEASHVPGAPWHKVFKVDNTPQALIPYALALDSKPGSITKEQADQIAEEERELATPRIRAHKVVGWGRNWPPTAVSNLSWTRRPRLSLAPGT
jgi:hypothetical protein